MHWFLTMFASVVHTRILLRLWDLFFYEGSTVLFQFTLGMLKMKVHLFFSIVVSCHHFITCNVNQLSHYFDGLLSKLTATGTFTFCLLLHSYYTAFSALMLLVWQQKKHLARKKLE